MLGSKDDAVGDSLDWFNWPSTSYFLIFRFFSFFFLPFLPSLSNFFFLFFFVEGKNTQTEARGVVSFFPLTTSQGRAGLTTCCFTAAPPLCNWINLQSAGNKSFFYSLFSLKTFSSLFTPWERMWSKRSKMAPYSKMPTWTKFNFRWIKKKYINELKSFT